VKAAQVCSSLDAMISQGHFNADVIVVDGYDFAATEVAELEQFRAFAADQGLEIWFSASLPAQERLPDSGEIPAYLQPYGQLLSIVMMLRPEKDHINLELVKDHDYPVATDPHLRLDQQILLISE
jgi:hypothetical protein